MHETCVRRIRDILARGVAARASDVHIVVGLPPLQRVHTILSPMEGQPPVAPDEALAFVKELLNESQLAKLLERRDFDFSAVLADGTRFRVNAHFQRGTPALAFRAIPHKVPELAGLNLPEIVTDFANLPCGLVLVTGETGSGKSTTLAAMIDHINHQRTGHVITLEDPIEYFLQSDQCVIEQREVGTDVCDFASGLRHVLRQDPDVILIGEMRDLETIATALTAAETGHLVLSTLHTNDAASTVERIIDTFPAAQQSQVRSMLASTLKGVVCQRLFPRVDVPGMVPATEILVSTPAVRNCIRENRVFEIPNVLETNRALGMSLFDESLKRLYFGGLISRDDAVSSAHSPDQLERALMA
ncbi:MAG: type IV pilus twitching motility protein PilT [Planctomycetes bacterium]|nr:type IV pilus twitching motility protein PilT [Planctomycetota bacterium]